MKTLVRGSRNTSFDRSVVGIPLASPDCHSTARDAGCYSAAGTKDAADLGCGSTD
jgi:hypothetical protein